MIGAPALTTPAVHTPVKTVHAVAKVPILKLRMDVGPRGSGVHDPSKT